jgi:hypothetical protein
VGLARRRGVDIVEGVCDEAWRSQPVQRVALDELVGVIWLRFDVHADDLEARLVESLCHPTGAAEQVKRSGAFMPQSSHRSSRRSVACAQTAPADRGARSSDARRPCSCSRSPSAIGPGGSATAIEDRASMMGFWVGRDGRAALARPAGASGLCAWRSVGACPHVQADVVVAAQARGRSWRGPPQRGRRTRPITRTAVNAVIAPRGTVEAMCGPRTPPGAATPLRASVATTVSCTEDIGTRAAISASCDP